MPVRTNRTRSQRLNERKNRMVNRRYCFKSFDGSHHFGFGGYRGVHTGVARCRYCGVSFGFKR